MSIKKYENKIICGDVVETLKKLPNDSVSLVVTSPPYNCGISYGKHEDDMSYQDWLTWMQTIWKECFRVLRTGGRLAINVDAVTNRQEDKDKTYIRNIYADFSNQMEDVGFLFRTEICWYKQNAVGRQTAWGSYKSCSNPTMRRNHEYVLVWSKGSWKLEGDSKLSDMTKEEFCQNTLSTWFITPEIRNMGGHPVPFPGELVKRLIKLYTYQNDVVLDVFNGSGTTTCMAKRLKRRYIGIDIDENYCKYAQERLESEIDLFA